MPGELEQAGLQRRIGFVAPSFILGQMAVAYTEFFFAAPREVVQPLATQLDMVMLEPPMALPTVRVALVWQERAHNDPGHRWLRELFGDIARRILSPAD